MKQTAIAPITQAQEFQRCPGCFGWIPRASLIKYPAPSIVDWRDYYLCPDCDRTIQIGWCNDYTRILTNINIYDGGRP